MTSREALFLVFAPATVSLLVTALRLAPRRIYWGVVLALLALATLVLGVLQVEVGRTVDGPLVLGGLLVVLPTLGAALAARLTLLGHRGTAVFTLACTGYLVGLAVAVGGGLAVGLLTP